MIYKQLECWECKKPFLYQQTLEDHVCDHKKDYGCPHCSKTYATRPYLREHMIKCHTG